MQSSVLPNPGNSSMSKSPNTRTLLIWLSNKIITLNSKTHICLKNWRKWNKKKRNLLKLQKKHKNTKSYISQLFKNLKLLKNSVKYIKQRHSKWRKLHCWTLANLKIRFYRLWKRWMKQIQRTVKRFREENLSKLDKKWKPTTQLKYEFSCFLYYYLLYSVLSFI